MKNLKVKKGILPLCIPFSWFPGAWGLRGQTREIAKAEYYYEGKDLELAKAHILYEDENDLKRKLLIIDHKYGDIADYEFEIQLAKLDISDETELKVKLLNINRHYNKIPEEEYQRELAEATLEGKDLELRIAKLDLNEEKITPNEYDKRVATIKEESWFKVVNVNYRSGEFEFDWNEYFIKELESAGFAAPKEEMVVDAWFNEVCKAITLENFKGDGSLEDIEDQDGSNNLVNIKDIGSGKKEIS